MKYVPILRKEILQVAALKPSEFRPFVKGWNKNKMKKLFTVDGKPHYRIYLPLIDIKTTLPPTKGINHIIIENFIEDKGYKLLDYNQGIAVNNKGRKLRVSRILKGNPSLYKLFINDHNRIKQSKDNLLVVISRHPYDIAGMSTHRGWTSCMNIVPSERPENEDDDYEDMTPYIEKAVKSETLIAYLVKKSDPNINKPLGRILLKPYYKVKNRKDKILVMSCVYGNVTPSFKETVKQWLNGKFHRQEGIYTLDNNIYPEETDDVYIIEVPDKYKLLRTLTDITSANVINKKLPILKKLLDDYPWLNNPEAYFNYFDNKRFHHRHTSERLEKQPFYVEGYWEKVPWKIGGFYGGMLSTIFEDGIFVGSNFKHSIFENGTFYNGRFAEDSIFKGGTFKGGSFFGTFKGGTFENGHFYLNNNKQWRGGNWKRGDVHIRFKNQSILVVTDCKVNPLVIKKALLPFKDDVVGYSNPVVKDYKDLLKNFPEIKKDILKK